MESLSERKRKLWQKNNEFNDELVELSQKRMENNPYQEKLNTIWQDERTILTKLRNFSVTSKYKKMTEEERKESFHEIFCEYVDKRQDRINTGRQIETYDKDIDDRLKYIKDEQKKMMEEDAKIEKEIDNFLGIDEQVTKLKLS